VFAYTEQQDQQQKKYQDRYESNTKGYELTNGTNLESASGVVLVVSSLTPDWKGEEDGLQPSM
jgi:hypothetical protein